MFDWNVFSFLQEYISTLKISSFSDILIARWSCSSSDKSTKRPLCIFDLDDEDEGWVQFSKFDMLT